MQVILKSEQKQTERTFFAKNFQLKRRFLLVFILHTLHWLSTADKYPSTTHNNFNRIAAYSANIKLSNICHSFTSNRFSSNRFNNHFKIIYNNNLLFQAFNYSWNNPLFCPCQYTAKGAVLCRALLSEALFKNGQFFLFLGKLFDFCSFTAVMAEYCVVWIILSAI